MAQSLAFLAAAREAAAAESLADGVTLYDPVPMRLHRADAPGARPTAGRIAAAVRRCRLFSRRGASACALKTPRDLRWHLDVDPLEF